jgi:hypothetical protein
LRRSRVPDDRLIINFSIWEDFDALRDFVYRSAHAGILKRRREWFERLSDAYVVLWVGAGGASSYGSRSDGATRVVEAPRPIVGGVYVPPLLSGS